MAVRSALDRVRVVDLAWNERRWKDYATLFAEELIAFSGGESMPSGKSDYLENARRFCDAFTDNLVHIDPYLSLFASHDGRHTCSIARVSGTAAGALELPGRKIVATVKRRFEVTSTLVCTWKNGMIIEQHKFFDMELMLRQLQGTSE